MNRRNDDSRKQAFNPALNYSDKIRKVVEPLKIADDRDNNNTTELLYFR